jgi:hypothetical protein
MPPKSVPLDLLRTNYICKSCIASLRLPPPTQPWPRFYSIGAGRKRAFGRRPPAPASGFPEDFADLAGPIPPGEAKPVIRYFNETEPGRYRQLKDNAEFNKVSTPLDQEIETSMAELEEQMENMAKLLDLTDKLDSPNMSTNMRQKYRRKLRDQLQFTKESRPAMQLQVPSETKSLFISSEGLHHRARELVDKLNRFFIKLSKDQKGTVSPEELANCWRLYSAVRASLRYAKGSWDNVPPEAWKVLWGILSLEGPENPNRMHHIFALGQDMTTAGVRLQPAQHLLVIEAIFLEGFEKEAIENWKRANTILGENTDTVKDYWELGVRMYSHHGDLVRARNAIDVLKRSEHDFDVQALFPLVRGLAKDVATRDQAWDTYREMRELLGDSMTIDHYDEVISAFLESGCVELGLHAFVDMMYSGAVNSHGKQALPVVVGNKFFIGKWLKRLIGAGDLTGAYQVLRFAQDKRVLVDAIQINGLLGAWFRSEAADNMEKAEKLAWAMIRSRLLFISLRQRSEAFNFTFRLQETMSQNDVAATSLGLENPADELTYVPRATLETFALLAQNYQSRGRTAELSALWTAFKQSEMRADSFLMNQLIRSALQSNDPSRAHAIYQDMAVAATTEQTGQTPPPVAADAETFVQLFQSLAINRLHAVPRGDFAAETQLARHIFSEMARSPFTMAPRVRDVLCKTALVSLMKLKDYAGALVAARALRVLCGFRVTEGLLLELMTGSSAKTVRMSPDMGGRRAKRKVLGATLEISQMVDRQERILQENGRSLDDLTEEERDDQVFIMLESMIRRRATPGGWVDEPEPSRVAAVDMGVFDVVVKADPTATGRLRKQEAKPYWEP